MKTSLDHLPAYKQRELDYILKIILQEFENRGRADAEGKPKKKAREGNKRKPGMITKVILFGSHARGDWVWDPETGYMSDYDILVVVNQAPLARPGGWHFDAELRLMDEHVAHRRLRSPVTLIVHTHKFVNEALGRGRYFFADIHREGVVLYDVPNYPLRKPAVLTEDLLQEERKIHFEQWFPSGSVFLEHAQFARSREQLRHAAFYLHQAAESCYKALLLILTNYCPNTHNTAKLHDLAKGYDKRLLRIWPPGDKVAKERFEKLRDAYVGARYLRDFTISDEELDWLTPRVELLGQLVEEIYRERVGEAPRFLVGHGNV